MNKSCDADGDDRDRKFPEPLARAQMRDAVTGSLRIVAQAAVSVLLDALAPTEGERRLLLPRLLDVRPEAA
jgi:hypothetical protein